MNGRMPPSATLRICALTAALTGSAQPAFADVAWSADGARSNVTLSVSHLLVAKINGTIPIASATLVSADGALVPLWVDATLDAAALTTHDVQRDADLRSDRFFDTARFPTITFASEHVSETGPLSFAIDGLLSMRGVTRPLRLEAHIAGLHYQGERRRVRYEATGRFRRSDFGMTYARGIVGNDVRLDIVIEAVG